MGLTEGLQLVSSRTNEGHMSSQVVESKGPEKKAMPEQSVKKRCFACHDTSHNLEQCGIKYNHTTYCGTSVWLCYKISVYHDSSFREDG